VRQEEIRIKLNQYFLDEGVTAKHVAKILQIHESVLSRFRKNKTDLYPETLDAIKHFLSVKQVN